MFLGACRRSDHVGARAMLCSLPKAGSLPVERGHVANKLREALVERGITARFPARRGRRATIPHDAIAYCQRHYIENMLGCLKYWRRVATRSDRCADTYLGATALAVTVMFWL